MMAKSNTPGNASWKEVSKIYATYRIAYHRIKGDSEMRAAMIQRKIWKSVSSCCMERKWLPWSLIHQVRTREELKNENVSYLTESVAGQSRSKNPSGWIETGWRGPAIVAFVCFTSAAGALYRVRIRAPPG